MMPSPRSFLFVALPFLLIADAPLLAAAWQAPALVGLEYVEVQKPVLKAALIATADDLGGQAGNDHRPSPSYGWGRVNLSRLLDTRVSRFFVDRADLAVSSTLPRVFERTITNPTKDTIIVLSWVDPPTAVVGGSQVGLVNNLQLVVEDLSASGAALGNWRGNNFEENVKGNGHGLLGALP